MKGQMVWFLITLLDGEEMQVICDRITVDRLCEAIGWDNILCQVEEL